VSEDFIAAEHVVVITELYGDYTCHIVVDSKVVIHSITSFTASIKAAVPQPILPTIPDFMWVSE